MSEISSILPFFPLRMLLLPKEQVPLYIFEPRYLQLFDELEKEKKQFVLPYEGRNKVRLGSLCRLVSVTKVHEDGALDVLVECDAVFDVKSIMPKFPGKLYPGGMVGAHKEIHDSDVIPLDTLNEFSRFIERKHGETPRLESIQHYSSMDIADCLALKNEDKVRILMADSEQSRQRIVKNQLKYLNFLLDQEESSENGIILN